MLLKGRYKTLGLAGLLAAMAMVVVASAGVTSAFAAEPTFSKSAVCNEMKGKSVEGHAFPENVWKYTENTCKTESVPPYTGNFALSPFISEGGEKEVKVLTTWPAKDEVECTSVHNVGEVYGPKHVWVTIKFDKCKLTKPAGGGECKSAGANAEEIVTVHLEGWLYWINQANKEAGMFLTAKEGTIFAEFTCVGPLGVKVEIKVLSGEKAKVAKGEGGPCIAARVKPVGVLSHKGELIEKTVENVATKELEQEVREVNYEGHKFNCELESEVTEPFGKKVERSTENESAPDLIWFLEEEEIK